MEIIRLDLELHRDDAFSKIPCLRKLLNLDNNTRNNLRRKSERLARGRSQEHWHQRSIGNKKGTSEMNPDALSLYTGLYRWLKVKRIHPVMQVVQTASRMKQHLPSLLHFRRIIITIIQR